MNRRSRRRLIKALAILVTTLITVEAMLYWIDPLGVYVYLSDQDTFFTQQVIVLSPDGYALKPGEYHFRHWQFSANQDGNRSVPASHGGNCTIAVLGDSVSFGWGVNDEDTWVNLLATANPGINIINTAKPGYSAGNIRRAIDLFPADGYIYLLNPNLRI